MFKEKASGKLFHVTLKGIVFIISLILNLKCHLKEQQENFLTAKMNLTSL
jgi:hypothetical protein